MKINEMRPGDGVQGFFILRDAARKVTATGKPFLSGTASDSSGSVEIKMWDYSGPIGPEDNGKVVKLAGKVSEYRGAPQISVEKLRLADENDVYSTDDLVPVAPIDRDEAYRGVRAMLEGLADADCRAVCLEMLDRAGDGFYKTPAAKSVHHSFVGGLLMHTWSMMRTADFLSGLYAGTVNRSLLIAGAFLHDLAKMREYDVSELGLVSDYTVSGMLVGHLVMGAMDVRDVCLDLGICEEKSVLLQHMVLSHHGKPEFGAAVACQCAESELLSYIDMIDSRMEIYAETFEKTETGEFSERVFALDGKRLYKHGFNENE